MRKTLNDMRKTLILLRGLPGSGKTNFAELLSLLSPEVFIIATDDRFMVNGKYKYDQSKLFDYHMETQQDVRMAMTENVPFIVVHNTFTNEKHMLNYTRLAGEHEYNVITLVVEHRHHGVSEHDVPTKNYLRMFKELKSSILLSNKGITKPLYTSDYYTE
tara:strand:+ start:205 stop:684 length:480 start_codon:yes stop_codon:yes gene_type:complete